MIFYYHRLNRFSFNALAGAMDNDPELAALPISLTRTKEELHAAAASILQRENRVIVALSILTIQCREIRSLVSKLRSDYGRRVTILAGGPHATATGDLWGLDPVIPGPFVSRFASSHGREPRHPIRQGCASRNLFHYLDRGRVYTDTCNCRFW